MPCRSLIEALYTLNSPPVVSLNSTALKLFGTQPFAEVACDAEATS